jgi:hypothetical protein
MSLTKKRRLVLSHYVSDPSATLEDALVKTGYSSKRVKITACELRRDPEFISAIERKQAQKLEKLERGELTDKEIIDNVRDIDSECQLQGPVAAYLQIRLKCQELLAKTRGLFVERVEFGLDAKLMERIDAARRRVDLPPVYDHATKTNPPELSQ